MCGDWAPENADLFQRIVSYRLRAGDDYATVTAPTPGRLVPADAIRATDAPEYDYGQMVAPTNHPEMRGAIALIGWHFKYERFFYFIDVDGKRKSRRYFPDELMPLDASLKTEELEAKSNEKDA